jgi:hypothetical protein
MKRRFFLKSAAGTLLAAPFLTSLREPARAAPPRAPTRNVIFHTPCGCLTNRWFPKVEDGPLDAAALAGTTLEALTPWVDKLLVPRGLRALNPYGVTQSIDPHAQAMGSKLTCAVIEDTAERYAASHSLDHEIARQVNPSGTLPLVVGPSSSDHYTVVLSYSGRSAPQPANADPASVYAGLGGILVDPGGEAAYRRRRGQSILDAVRDDLASYQRIDMSQSDQRRVDAWLALLRDTEQGLAACAPASVDLDPESLAGMAGTSSDADAFTVGADLMMQLMALTLLCDANRSLVMTFPGYVVFDWDGIHHTRNHDGLAHRTGDFTVGGNCLEGVLDMLLEIDRWYAQKFARLVGLFGRIPEGDGTLLDNTATTWLQEFSDGSAANLNNLPVVIAGSAGGYLKQGVAVSLEDEPIGPGNSESTCANGGPITGNAGSVGGNVPINKLYVTLLNAVGCQAPGGGPVTSFGDFDGENAEDGIRDPGELSALRA